MTDFTNNDQNTQIKNNIIFEEFFSYNAKAINYVWSLVAFTYGFTSFIHSPKNFFLAILKLFSSFLTLFFAPLSLPIILAVDKFSEEKISEAAKHAHGVITFIALPFSLLLFAFIFLHLNVDFDLPESIMNTQEYFEIIILRSRIINTTFFVVATFLMIYIITTIKLGQNVAYSNTWKLARSSFVCLIRELPQLIIFIGIISFLSFFIDDLGIIVYQHLHMILKNHLDVSDLTLSLLNSDIIIIVFAIIYGGCYCSSLQKFSELICRKSLMYRYQN
jgi:hypothetical protein